MIFTFETTFYFRRELETKTYDFKDTMCETMLSKINVTTCSVELDSLSFHDIHAEVSLNHFYPPRKKVDANTCLASEFPPFMYKRGLLFFSLPVE